MHGFRYGSGGYDGYDGYNSWEAPDNTSLAAVALSVSGAAR